MARIRNIKPEFFLNEEVAELPMEARLAFIGLWTQADCFGRLQDRPKRLKMALFPYDAKVDMEKILAGLAESGLITRYENGGNFIQINTFCKHQMISNREREAGSDIPAPDEASTKQVQVLDKTSTGTGSVHDRSDDIGHRTQDTGQGTQDKEPPTAVGVTDPLDAVPEIQEAYPRIQSAILKAHPRARIPKPGSEEDAKCRQTLEQLVRLDKYPEGEVLAVLRWILKAETDGAVFWLEQFHSIAALRKVTNGATKFTKMHERWKRDTAGPPKKPREENESERLIAEAKRQQGMAA